MRNYHLFEFWQKLLSQSKEKVIAHSKAKYLAALTKTTTGKRSRKIWVKMDLENCSLYETPPLPQMEKFIKGPLTGTLIAIGLVLNFFSLIVLQKLKNRSQIHRYIQGLSVWDNLLLFSGFMVHTLPVLLYGRPMLTGPYIYTYRWHSS